MRVLVTGISGFVGAELAPRLRADGHDVVGFARDAARVTVRGVPVVEGDAITGRGLEEALDGVDVAYFLIHSMEHTAAGAASPFAAREQRAAEAFVDAAGRAGVRRIVYLGGLVPTEQRASSHLSSRLAVEEALLAGVPDSVALRASIVVAARSRSFRFLVRLVERLPVMALPSWRENRTQPIDGRDVIEFLLRAATLPAAGGRSLDIAGPDVLTYGELIARIRDHMLLARPTIGLGFSLTPIASRVAAVIAGEDPELIGPLMEGLETDLLPRDDHARELFGVRLHRFDRAVEHALGEWERAELLAAR